MNNVMKGSVMAILPIYYTTTNMRKRKARMATQGMIEGQRKTNELLERVGYFKGTKSVTKKFTYSLAVESNAAPMANTIPGGIAAKRDKLNDHKWKRGSEESAATIKAIEEKAMRVAPAYNKGATQYITDGTDAKYLGRKI
jgi:hypothetical protein